MTRRAGDVRESPARSPTVVTGVVSTHIVLRWPWWKVDPDADGIRCNGDVAVGRDDRNELYVTEPPANYLMPGDTCQVGIRPRIIHIIEVHEHDPPLETG